MHEDVFTLACPCLPVLEVVISTILQGRPFSMTKPFFLSAEHCMGNVEEAPESAVVKSSSAMMGHGLIYVTQMSKRKQEYVTIVALPTRMLGIKKQYSEYEGANSQD